MCRLAFTAPSDVKVDEQDMCLEWVASLFNDFVDCTDEASSAVAGCMLTFLCSRAS